MNPNDISDQNTEGMEASVKMLAKVITFGVVVLLVGQALWGIADRSPDLAVVLAAIIGLLFWNIRLLSSKNSS